MRTPPSQRWRSLRSAGLPGQGATTLASLGAPLDTRNGPCGGHVNRGRRQFGAAHLGRACELALGTMSVGHARIVREFASPARPERYLFEAQTRPAHRPYCVFALKGHGAVAHEFGRAPRE